LQKQINKRVTLITQYATVSLISGLRDVFEDHLYYLDYQIEIRTTCLTDQDLKHVGIATCHLLAHLTAGNQSREKNRPRIKHEK
jgi:hypothetical protein